MSWKVPYIIVAFDFKFKEVSFEEGIFIHNFGYLTSYVLQRFWMHKRENLIYFGMKKMKYLNDIAKTLIKCVSYKQSRFNFILIIKIVLWFVPCLNKIWVPTKICKRNRGNRTERNLKSFYVQTNIFLLGSKTLTTGALCNDPFRIYEVKVRKEVNKLKFVF